MTGAPADIAEASPVVEVEADLEAEDLLLEAAVVGTEKCFRLFAVTAEKNAKFLLSPQTVNRFIAAIVLKKWAEEAIQGVPKEPSLDPKLPLLTKAAPNLMP
jgi:adenylyl- and sulfurtransferase ThiI